VHFAQHRSGFVGKAFFFLALILLGNLAAAQSDRAAPVRVEQVQQQAIQRAVKLTGTVTSAHSAALSTSTAGLVTALNVDAGSKVEANDVLLKLDPALARWQLQSAQAEANAAAIALSDARRRLEEARKLAPQFTVAESVVRDLEAEVAQDEAAVQRADAEAGYRKGILERHQLRAPFAGIISTKQTELGEWVNPGQSVLTLVATQELRMDFPAAEDYLADVSIDSPVTYSLGDDYQDMRPGNIMTIVPVTDPGARTFLIRLEAKDSDSRMIPGMSARAQLTLSSGRSGLTVPRDAILKFPDGRAVVWVVQDNADGPKVSETRVDTGAVFDGMVEVIAGLSAGEQVVVEGNEALQNGQRVTLLSEQPD
jgi:membrane fusion protein, multidrug efflux system